MNALAYIFILLVFDFQRLSNKEESRWLGWFSRSVIQMKGKIELSAEHRNWHGKGNYRRRYISLLLACAVRYELLKKHLERFMGMRMGPELINNGSIDVLEEVDMELKVLTSSLEILEELYRKRIIK